MAMRRALVASVALHGAALLVLLALPEPEPPAPRPRFADVELVTFDAIERPTAPARAEPDPAPQPEADAEPDAEPEPPTPTPDRREPAREPDAPTGAPTGEPSADPTLEPPPAPDPRVDTEPTGDPPPGALALSGHRKRDAGSLAPTLPDGVVFPRARPGRPASSAARSAGEITTPAEAGFVRKRDGRLVFRDPDPGAQWSAELLPDGRIRFKDHLLPKPDPGGGGAGLGMPGLKELVPASQGVTFWLQRKKRLLADTRAMRLTMAIAFAEKNIDRQVARLYRDLLAIWRSDDPPHTRRGLLFATWDDCEEHVVVALGEFEDTEVSKVDDLRRDAGHKARAQIIAFIRRHVPEGSADAFTTAELASMNRGRTSSARFEPYAAL